MHPPKDDRYQAMHAAFAWHVPEFFNMAQACAQRWAQQRGAGARVAVIDQADLSAAAQQLSFAALYQQALQLSGALQAHGVEQGERVAIVLPQRAETAVAYMATMGMGATLAGPGDVVLL
ncbi:MAG: AMP-binding protein, partial [Burkholderiaceae bacterium]